MGKISFDKLQSGRHVKCKKLLTVNNAEQQQNEETKAHRDILLVIIYKVLNCCVLFSLSFFLCFSLVLYRARACLYFRCAKRQINLANNESRSGYT